MKHKIQLRNGTNVVFGKSIHRLSAMSLLEDTSMKAHRYTIDQLLDLKKSLPFVSCVINNINKHPDIG